MSFFHLIAVMLDHRLQSLVGKKGGTRYLVAFWT
ncbi:hypothetical protein [Xenorhabdus sp. PR6a]